MKTDDDLLRYIRLADGDAAEAYRIARKEHEYSDQSLEVKKARIEQLVKEGK